MCFVDVVVVFAECVIGVVDVVYCGLVLVTADFVDCVPVLDKNEVVVTISIVVVVEASSVDFVVFVVDLEIYELFTVVTVEDIVLEIFLVIEDVEDKDIIVLVLVVDKCVVDTSVETVEVSVVANVPFVVPVVGLKLVDILDAVS